MDFRDWAEELADMVRRRLWLILRVVALGFAASFLFALSQTHQYTSMAVLQVEGARVADALAPPTVTGVNARQLQTVEQKIMAREAMLETAGALGLLDDLAGLPDSGKVTALRKSVSVSGVEAARTGTSEDGALSLVRVSATWDDRAKAQALAAAVAERTIDLLGDGRLSRARETLDFFSLRETLLKQQIADLETTIASFRADNGIAETGLRPTQEREIEALRAEILSIERQMVVLEGQVQDTGEDSDLTRVEQQQRAERAERLRSLREQRDYLAASLASVSAAAAQSPELQLQLARYQRELEALRTDLEGVSEAREAAEVGYQLESQGQSERLGILEPASWPDYPSTPSRTKMALLGAVASVMIALGLAFWLDMIRPVVRSAAVMERELGFGPVVTVPEAASPRRGVGLARIFGRRRGPA